MKKPPLTHASAGGFSRKPVTRSSPSSTATPNGSGGGGGGARGGGPGGARGGARAAGRGVARARGGHVEPPPAARVGDKNPPAEPAREPVDAPARRRVPPR